MLLRRTQHSICGFAFGALGVRSQPVPVPSAREDDCFGRAVVQETGDRALAATWEPTASAVFVSRDGAVGIVHVSALHRQQQYANPCSLSNLCRRSKKF